MWEPYRNGFKAHLQLERSLSSASVEAYLGDLEKLTQYLSLHDSKATPASITLDQLQDFLKWVAPFLRPGLFFHCQKIGEKS